MKIYKNKRSVLGGSNPYQNGEVEVWNFIQNKFLPSTVLDVGIEKESYIVDNRQHDNTTVWLFEPNPVHYADVIKKYSAKHNVFFENIGLSDVDENQILYVSTGSIFLRNKSMSSGKLNQNTVSISCKTLDNFCKEKLIQAVDFLKIDVEGYELKVLQGAKLTIENINLIQFEFGGTYVDAGITIDDVLNTVPDRHIYIIEKMGLNRVTKEQACKETVYTNFLISKKDLECT